MAVRLGSNKIGSIEGENEPAHMFVDVATQNNKSRLVEENRRDWAFVWAIAPQIEAFSRGIGKDVVINVVLVGEFDRRSGLDGEECGKEPQIFLRDLLGELCNGLGKSSFEINDRHRGICRQDATLGHDFISLDLDWREVSVWQRDPPLDGRLRESHLRTRNQEKTNEANTHIYELANSSRMAGQGKLRRVTEMLSR